MFHYSLSLRFMPSCHQVRPLRSSEMFLVISAVYGLISSLTTVPYYSSLDISISTRPQLERNVPTNFGHILFISPPFSHQVRSKCEIEPPLLTISISRRQHLTSSAVRKKYASKFGDITSGSYTFIYNKSE